MGFVIFGIRYNRLVCGTPEASQMGGIPGDVGYPP